MSGLNNLTAGIDVGSSAIKVAITKSAGGADAQVLSTVVQRIRRRNVHEVVSATFEEAREKAGVSKKDFDYIASTGDGDAVDFATGHFYGMTTHARGAVHLVPGATAVIDMGALHARAIRMDERGRVLAHRMTSQCASGSGQFLENIARYLGVPLEDVGAVSQTSTQAEEVSSICAVLAETDVINMVSRGLTAADILKGIHLSIGGRLVKLMRAAGGQGIVALSGGMAHDVGLVSTLDELFQREQGKGKSKGVLATAVAPITVKADALSIFAGAIGAALVGAHRFEQLKKQGRQLGAAVTAMA